MILRHFHPRRPPLRRTAPSGPATSASRTRVGIFLHATPSHQPWVRRQSAATTALVFCAHGIRRHHHPRAPGLHSFASPQRLSNIYGLHTWCFCSRSQSSHQPPSTTALLQPSAALEPVSPAITINFSGAGKEKGLRHPVVCHADPLGPAGSNADARIVAEERIIYTLHLLNPPPTPVPPSMRRSVSPTQDLIEHLPGSEREHLTGMSRSATSWNIFMTPGRRPAAPWSPDGRYTFPARAESARNIFFFKN